MRHGRPQCGISPRGILSLATREQSRRRDAPLRLVSVVAAAVAAEDPGFITPLMESLESDLLPRHDDAGRAFNVRLHSFDAAVERALREWELTEEVAAK